MPLPAFTVTGTLNDILASVSGGEITTSAWTSARLVFAHNIRRGVLVWDSEVYDRPPAVGVSIDPDGSIGGPVVLLANDPGLNVENIQWRCEIRNRNTVITSFWFDAPADGATVNLASVAHVASTSANPVPGLTEEQMIALVNDEDSDLRAAIDAVAGGLPNVVDDTTPQLGGNLDLNGFTVGDATAADLTKLHAVTADATELSYVDGVTSSIQTQLTARALASRTVNGQALTGDVSLTQEDVPDSEDFKQFSAANQTKLAGIEALADVTDAANVAAAGAVMASAANVINDAGADVDQRIEGDTDPNLLFVDASTDRVGIGTATPSQKLTVDGNIAVTGLVDGRDIATDGTTLDNFVETTPAVLVFNGETYVAPEDRLTLYFGGVAPADEPASGNPNDVWFPASEPGELPDQAGNAGKVLTTDGTTASWESASADVAAAVVAASAKTTPHDDDLFGLVDSEASNVLKKLTWANLKATVKSYLDGTGIAKLTTARTFRTNLASTSTASFDGTANVTPGVDGTLPVGNGGTGATTLTGLVKGSGTSALSAAVEGTDYYAPGGTDVAVADGGTGVSTITGIVKGNGTSAFTAASAGTDYVAPGGALGTPSSGTLTSCTGLPVAGITASTSTALGVGSVELGHATDTTITRVSAGLAAVEGDNIVTATATQTVSNKTFGVSNFADFREDRLTIGRAADTTTKIRFQPSTSQSSGTTADITIPSANGSATLVGTSATQTLSSKTLTAPKIVDNGFIADNNGNEVIVVGQTTSAVNEIKVSNAATGSGPTIAAQGGDTNVPLNLAGKGTRGVVLRHEPRIGTVASSATPSIDVTAVEQYNITALAAAITSMSSGLSGTAFDGQDLWIRFKDNGTARTITWGASFVSSGVATLLATTVANKTHLVKLRYDSAAALWVCVAVDAVGY